MRAETLQRIKAQDVSSVHFHQNHALLLSGLFAQHQRF
jgi:hypothetical protein